MLLLGLIAGFALGVVFGGKVWPKIVEIF